MQFRKEEEIFRARVSTTETTCR